MASKKKQEEENLRVLREMVTMAHNKHCFDCNQRGPTYVNMTIGSFICTSCSGLLRGLNPPHRVKSISMASFTSDEMEFIKIRGNAFCKRVWFGLHDGRMLPDSDLRDENKMRDLMGQKYEKKRWYVHPTEEFYDDARKQNACSTQKHAGIKPISTLVGHNLPALNSSKLGALQSSAPTQSVQRPPHGTVHPSPGPLQSPAPSAPQSPTARQEQQPPQKSASLNILATLGGDPFAGTAANDSQLTAEGFADFSAFGNQQPSTQKPVGLSHQQQQQLQSTPSPWATAPSAVPMQPLHSGAKATVVTAPAAPVPSAVDKYSALAELESVFSAMSGPSSVNWDGGSGPGMRGGSVFGSNPAQPVMSSGFGYGGTGHAVGTGHVVGTGHAVGPPPPSYASLGATTVANPFGMSGSMPSQPVVPGPTVNPFMSNAGYNQPLAPSAGGFGQYRMPQSGPAVSGTNNVPAVTGSYAAMGYAGPPGAVQNGGIGGGVMWGVMPPSQHSQVPQQNSGWGQQVQANPFGGAAPPRPNNVTNPFL